MIVKILNILNLNTKNVTNMSCMFGGCSNLAELKISNKFFTENVTDMSGMFLGCINLKFLDLSNFNTNNVTKWIGCFINAAILKKLI